MRDYEKQIAHNMCSVLAVLECNLCVTGAAVGVQFHTAAGACVLSTFGCMHITTADCFWQSISASTEALMW